MPNPPLKYECTLPGCGRKTARKLYCNKHYDRWKKHGDPLHDAVEAKRLIRTQDGFVKDGVGHLPLGNGLFAFVDEHLFHELNAHVWGLHGSPGNQYVARSVTRNYRRTVIRIHNEILKPKRGFFVDHVNRATRDNRICNLRLCTVEQNSWNKGPQRGRKFKGVYEEDGQFRASIMANGRKYRLGFFPTPELAAAAYNGAARVLHGEFAYINPLPKP